MRAPAEIFAGIKRDHALTGDDRPRHTCPRCHDARFLAREDGGQGTATPCTCLLDRQLLNARPEDRPALELQLQTTERRYLQGEIDALAKMPRLRRPPRDTDCPF